MNSFFKSFWAALLAFVIGSILTFLLAILVMAGIAASVGSGKPAVIQSNSVLKIDLGSTIVDSPSNKSVALDLSLFSYTPSNTLMEVLVALDHAEKDKNIHGIYINFTGTGSMSIAQAEEIRAAIVGFKENSGKFVVAYNESFSQLGYYLSSSADKIIMNPEGFFEWRGIAASVMFYKGLLDKLGIQAEILRHGTFKSAVEPYMLDKMSPANRLQMETYVNSLWNVVLDEIAASRGITKEQLQAYAATLAIKSPADARNLGLVDEVMYEDQVNSLLAAMVAGEEIEDYATLEEKKAPHSVSLGDYIAGTALSSKRISKNKVAVIYAEGGIKSGESRRDVVGSATVAEQLADARRDNSVKAVVFRVNSPGGSALASEVMWREVELLRKEKPVVVSMGNYAASGGYYISCNADAILADRTTLTGSIGVFGLMMNLEKGLREKLGITVDVAKSAPYGDMGSSFRAMEHNERAFMMKQIESVYNTFVNHVAQGRNMTFEAVDAIGEGRIWLGTDALGIGLIDGFGGIKDAVALAADRAGIADDFRVYEITEHKKPFDILIEAIAGGADARMKNELGEVFKEYNHLMNTLKETGVQARMPYLVEFY